MKNTKILAVLLVFCMALTMLIACKSDESEETKPQATTPPAVTESGYETDKDGYELSGLPEMKFDDEFHLFSWQNQLHWEFNATELTGEPIYDTVFERKKFLEDTYGIKIIVSKANGDWDHKDEFVKTVEANQSETGDNAWDAVGCYFASSGSMTVKGFFEDLSDEKYAPYIDLERRWWPEDLLGSAKINNAVYAVTGDITPTFIRNLSVCHVNMDLFEQYNSGVNLYKLVDNKEWTYEKLMELALGKVDVNAATPQKGLTMDNNVVVDDIFYSAGFTLVDNLEDGTIQIHDMGSDQKMIDFYDFVRALLQEHNDVSYTMTMQSAGGFKEGFSMFHFGNAAQVQNYLLEVEWDYASLPYPMYKTSQYTTQDEYHAVQGFWTTLYSIPINCADHELASFAIEALAWYGYKYLTPTWFTESFQTRFLETPDNARMFEIIRNGVIFDTARVFGTHINCFGTFRKTVQDTVSLAQYFESNREKWETAVAEINAGLGKNS